MIIAMLTVPMASVATESQTPVWDAPYEGELTEEDVERFINLWQTRLVLQEPFQAFLDHPGIPEDIRQEGFHDLDPDSQRYLTARLYESLVADLPSFRAQLIGLDDQAREQKAEELRQTLFLFIFEKDALQSMFSEEIDEPEEPAEPEGPSELDLRLEALAQIAPLEKGTVSTPPSYLASPDPVVREAAELAADHPARSLDLELGTQVPDHRLARLGAQAWSPSPMTVEDPLPGEPPETEALLAQVRNVVDATTYAVCAEGPGMSLTCSPEVPLGTPAPADVDGDGLPDVLAQLTPSVDLDHPLGFTAAFQVTRTDSLLDEPLPGHVFAVFEVPTAFKRFVVGFDGQADTLAPSSQVQFTLKDVPMALAGDIQAKMSITYEGPGASTGLTFAAKELEPTALADTVPGLGDPVAVDPVAGAFHFTPTPESFVLDARIQEADNADQLGFEINTSAPAVLETALVLHDTDVNEARTMHALIDQLPELVTLNITTEAVGATQASYRGSAPIDVFAFEDRLVYDAEDPATYRELVALVEDIPEQVAFSMTTPMLATYTASAPVSTVEVRIDEIVDGSLATRMAGAATDLPTDVRIEGIVDGATTTYTYDADASISELSFLLVDNTGTPIEAGATITDLPTQIQASSQGAAITYQGDGPIGQVEAYFISGNGQLGQLPGDHAYIIKDGQDVGAHLVLSGIQAVSIDPTDGGAYHLELSPGGQAFQAQAELDQDKLITLSISDLPSQIDVDLASPSNSFTYEAAGGIASIQAGYEELSTGRAIDLELVDLPSSVTVTWQDGQDQLVTYEASENLGLIDVFYREATGAMTLAAQIDTLPRYMALSAGQDVVAFDARTGPDAAPATSEIGQISVAIASDGQLLTGLPANDHAVLRQTTGQTRAALQYSGLANLVADTSQGGLDLHIENSQARLFTASLHTPDLQVEGVIDKIPAVIDLTSRNDRIDYQASATIDQILLDVDTRDGQQATADLQGMPDQLTLDLAPGTRMVEWQMTPRPLGGCTVIEDPVETRSLASGAYSCNAEAHVTATLQAGADTWDVTFDADGIPDHWTLIFPDDEVTFDAISGSLGNLAATVTNHGSVTTFSGNHLSAIYDGATGNMDASLSMAKINLASFKQTADGFTSDLRMGGGGGLFLNADLRAGTQVVKATVSINPLPTSIQVTQTEDVFTYDANQNFDLSAYTEVGHRGGLGDTPNPPTRRGLSVRDGSGCDKAGSCGDGLKARVFLQGFPTHLSADASSRTYTMENFDPPADAFLCSPWGGCFTVAYDYLELDVELDAIVAQPVDLYARQNDMGHNLDITFGPIIQDEVGSDKRTKITYDASHAMGSFNADVQVGSNAGRLEISNIPADLVIEMRMGNPTSTVSVDASQGISRIFVGLKAQISDTSFAGRAELTDIPADVALTFGRIESGSGDNQVDVPGVSYDASASTLDITLGIDASLFGGDLTARVQVDIVNLAASTDAYLDGNVFKIRSNPTDTDRLEVHIWAQYRVLKHFSGCKPGCGDTLRVEYNGHAGVTPATVEDLQVKLTNVRSFDLNLGATSAITGNYGAFTFGWQDINIHLDVKAYAKAVADFGVFGTWSLTLMNIHTHQWIDVSVAFHKFGHHTASWKEINTFVPCEVAWDPDTWHFGINIKPHYHSREWNSFTVTAASAENGAWLVTPNPWGVLSYDVMRLAAMATSPLDSGMGTYKACK